MATSLIPDLRPRSVGELLDLTFLLYKRSFLRLIGITLVVMGPMVALNLLGSTVSLTQTLALFRNAANDVGVDTSPATAFTSLASTCASGLALLVGIFVAWMEGALIFYAIENLLGRRPTWRDAYRASRPRWGALWIAIAVRSIVLAVLLVPLVIGVYGAAIGGVLGAGALATAPGNNSDASLLLIGLLAVCMPLGLAWGAVAIFVWVSWSMAGPAIVGEGVPGIESLGRSNGLVKGYRLRLAGRLLIFEVMRFVVITLPLLAVQIFIFGGAIASISGTSDVTPLGVLVAVLGTLIGLLAEILVTPLNAIYITLNYVDLRVRKENLDLQLKAAQLSANQPAQVVPPAMPIGAVQATSSPTGETRQVAAAEGIATEVLPPASPAPAGPVSHGMAARPATSERDVDAATLTPAQRAALLFKRMRLEGPSAELLNELGLAYRQIGDTYGALDAFTRARTLAPDDAAIVYNLALLQRDRRDIAAARHAIADYLRLEKDPAERQKVLEDPTLKAILPSTNL